MRRGVSKNLEVVRDGINRNAASRGLFIFVIVPTLLTIFYYFFIASDVYVSESKFSVNVEGKAVGASPLSSLIPTMSAAGNLHEATVVKEYVSSPAMIEKLKQTINLGAIYDNPKADMISRIPKDLRMEEYQKRYADKVEIIVDEISGITTLRVRAYTPQDAKKLGDAIVNEAEDFVNKMALRVQEDAVKFAEHEVGKSEKMVLDINTKLGEFRSENKNFDPTVTATNIVQITTKLEDELAQTNAEIANLRNYMQPNSPKIQSLEGKAAALRQQIDMQSGRLTEDNNAKLSKQSDAYASLALQKEFALKRMEITLASMESAQAEARKKSRYLLRIVEPTLPEKAVEPRRIREVLTIFIGLLMTYTLGGLILAAIKDHIRP